MFGVVFLHHTIRSFSLVPALRITIIQLFWYQRKGPTGEVNSEVAGGIKSDASPVLNLCSDRVAGEVEEVMKKSKAKLKEEEAEKKAAAQEDTTAPKDRQRDGGMSPDKRNWRVCVLPCPEYPPGESNRQTSRTSLFLSEYLGDPQHLPIP